MDKKKLMSKILPTVVAGSVLLSTSCFVYAQSTNKKTNDKSISKVKDYKVKKSQSENKTLHKRRMELKLNELVKSSVITEAQKDKILEYKKEHLSDKKIEKDKLKNMTKEERKTYFNNIKKQKAELFNSLVKDGVISQQQADSIKQSMSSKQ